MRAGGSRCATRSRSRTETWASSRITSELRALVPEMAEAFGEHSTVAAQHDHRARDQRGARRRRADGDRDGRRPAARGDAPAGSPQPGGTHLALEDRAMDPRRRRRRRARTAPRGRRAGRLHRAGPPRAPRPSSCASCTRTPSSSAATWTTASPSSPRSSRTCGPRDGRCPTSPRPSRPSSTSGATCNGAAHPASETAAGREARYALRRDDVHGGPPVAAQQRWATTDSIAGGRRASSRPRRCSRATSCSTSARAPERSPRRWSRPARGSSRSSCTRPRGGARRRAYRGSAVTVVRTDAADLLLPTRPFRVVANPPFAVTTALLRRLPLRGAASCGRTSWYHLAHRGALGPRRRAGHVPLGPPLRRVGRRAASPRRAFAPPARNGVAVLVLRRRGVAR